MGRNLVSILDGLKTADDFFNAIYIKAYSNFIEDPSVFNAMMAAVSCQGLCAWLIAENKTTWKDIKENCNELRILISLANHFKHKEETHDSSRPIQLTRANESFVDPEGDYRFGSFVVYSDLQTEKGLADGNNDLELMLESADRYLRGKVFNTPDIPF